MAFFNLDWGVVDKEVFWDTVKKRNNWKLQKHKITGHYRIIGPDQKRKAWGLDYEELSGMFQSFAKEAISEQQLNVAQASLSKEALYNELQHIADLAENGAISKQEHEKLKKAVLDKLDKLNK